MEETIPEDVREAAIRAVYATGFPGGDLPSAVLEADILAIVRVAIAAEREAQRERVFEALSVMYDGWVQNPGTDDSGAIALSMAMFNLFPEKAKSFRQIATSIRSGV